MSQPPKMIRVENTCGVCRKMIPLTVNEDGYEAWNMGWKRIQDALPELTPGQRELLISQTCEPCFDKIAGKEEP